MSENNPYTDGMRPVNTVSANPFTFQDELSDDELKRIQRESLFWKFYNGKQWKRKRKDGEPQNTINYCRAFVDKGVSFLMGKGFKIDTKPEARDVTKPLLKEVWEDNKKELLSLEIAQGGGVTGNAFVKVAVETFDEEENPEQYEIYPQGKIRIINLPSYSVFPTWHPHDKDRMTKCRIIYPITVEEERHGETERSTVWYKEVITRDIIREFMDGELVDKRENELNEIPVVRVKNLPLSGSSLGVSDLSDIIPLQKELNYKTTDISDIINYHSAPITIIKGAKASHLEKGNRKIWGGLPKDADVFNLELESDLTAAMDYIDDIKKFMFELGNMPDEAFGGQNNISNTSGVALHIKNQPLMEQTEIKYITYGEGIKDINRLIIKYAKMIEHPMFDKEAWDNLPPSAKYKSSVEFPDPLPKDELIEMQLIAQKIKLMLMSRKDALIKLGEDEAAKKLQEIISEATLLENAIYDGDLADMDLDALKTNIGGIVRDVEKAKDEDLEGEDDND